MNTEDKAFIQSKRIRFAPRLEAVAEAETTTNFSSTTSSSFSSSSSSIRTFPHFILEGRAIVAARPKPKVTVLASIADVDIDAKKEVVSHKAEPKHRRSEAVYKFPIHAVNELLAELLDQVSHVYQIFNLEDKSAVEMYSVDFQQLEVLEEEEEEEGDGRRLVDEDLQELDLAAAPEEPPRPQSTPLWCR